MKDKNAEKIVRSLFRKASYDEPQYMPPMDKKRIVIDLLMAGGLMRRNLKDLWKEILGIKRSNYDAYLSSFSSRN